MEKPIEILLAGTGGQGLGLAGVILARAFTEEEGKNVVQTEAYGISMRGGLSRSEVLVSTEEIDELKITEPNILLALSQAAADIYILRVKEKGIIFLDPDYVTNILKTTARVFPFPFAREARKLGRETVANVIALGAIASVSSVIAKESLENTLKKMFSSSARNLNVQALDKGYELGNTAIGR